MELLFIKHVVRGIDAKRQVYHVNFKFVYIYSRSAP